MNPARIGLRLLEDALAHRDATTDDVRATLADHCSFPDGICRHIAPEAAADDRFRSAYSIVMDIDEREPAIAGHHGRRECSGLRRLGRHRVLRELARLPPSHGGRVRLTA
ncbi:hypothetical protein HDA32_003003 [Spinactinospora alkalitolerans]|uniref:Uncharacterized protein n=1 Tax=Spinactinospora alkalitolerans TaxID=687207 RepID=A0A852TYL1_9ACTN|nr:hypothetical protein [Spinactinospora alkalitolerans]NYE47883.1 hypothetical protein [Spinactinospora alkalitolerans]